MPTPRLAVSRAAALLAALGALLGTAACGGEQAERVPIETEDVIHDPFAGTAPQRLPVVVRASTYLPLALDTVRVTDVDQVRERLGEPALGFDGPSADATPATTDVWTRADEEAALLTGGLLRPQAARLERDYGFGPDDVLWEAAGTDADGEVGDAWVLAFHRGVDPGVLQRAADDRVGVLAGGRVLAGRRVVVAGSAEPDTADGWRQTRAVVGAGGHRDVESVYLHAGCVPLEHGLGPGSGATPRDDRAAARLRAAHHLDDYEPVEAFAVVFGGEVATARLGMAAYSRPRGDLFDRADLVDDWPGASRFHDAFGATPVVDPSTGRIGFPLHDPAAAAALTSAGVAPYAACAEDG